MDCRAHDRVQLSFGNSVACLPDILLAMGYRFLIHGSMKRSPQVVPYCSATSKRQTDFILFIENSVLLIFMLKMPCLANFLADLDRIIQKIICHLFTVKAANFSP